MTSLRRTTAGDGLVRGAMLLLVSNDDGIDAPGIEVLARALAPLGQVMVVAPSTERSAQSHALTMHEPLRVSERAPGRFACSGQPADCVYLGVHHLCATRPTAVISGINRGSNLGDDVHYSGTVGAAEEAALMGIPALAVSLHPDRANAPDHHWQTAAELAVRVLRAMVADPLPPRVFLNLNVPDLPLDQVPGIRAAALGRREYQPMVAESRDPRGREYYWVGGAPLAFDQTEGTDGYWFSRGFATLTPLHPDHTHRATLDRLSRWTALGPETPG